MQLRLAAISGTFRGVKTDLGSDIGTRLLPSFPPSSSVLSITSGPPITKQKHSLCLQESGEGKNTARLESSVAVKTLFCLLMTRGRSSWKKVWHWDRFALFFNGRPWRSSTLWPFVLFDVISLASNDATSQVEMCLQTWKIRFMWHLQKRKHSRRFSNSIYTWTTFEVYVHWHKKTFAKTFIESTSWAHTTTRSTKTVDKWLKLKIFHKARSYMPKNFRKCRNSGWNRALKSVHGNNLIRVS